MLLLFVLMCCVMFKDKCATVGSSIMVVHQLAVVTSRGLGLYLDLALALVVSCLFFYDGFT
jgi:hypothetical protein